MKRAAPAVLTMLTVLSLLLAILVAGAWGRSYWRWDRIRIVSADGRTFHGATLPRGTFGLYIVRADMAGLWTKSYLAWWGYRSSPPEDAEDLAHEFIGLGWEQTQQTFGSRSSPNVLSRTIIHIHDAYLLALFAALPAVRGYRWLRRGRIVPVGSCKECGYDLRATPDRCPECGTAVG